ncbi:MAG: efflux RND transporter periplasmic adaptor subunit [Planctomycetota bacterium]
MQLPIAKPVAEVLEWTGNTSPVEQVDVRARVEGFLESIEFREGEDVEEGELLFVIDPRPFQATLNGARASQALAEATLEDSRAGVERAKANVINAESQYRRAVQAGPAISPAEVDELRAERDSANANYQAAEASVESAKAQILAAKAAVEQAELDLDYTQVKAPISGRVGRRMVDVGNLVGSSEPTLLTQIVKYEPIYAYFSMSEAELLQWIEHSRQNGNESNPSEEATGDKPMWLGLANEDGYPHEGRYDFADLTVDQDTGTFMVRAVFDNPNRNIPPGAFARLQVSLDETPALLVPQVAVSRDQSGPYLLTVNSKNIVERRNVELGRVLDNMQVVVSGLFEDDRVIVNGVQRARPSSPVTPQTQDASGNPAAGQPSGQPTSGRPESGEPAPADQTPAAQPDA